MSQNGPPDPVQEAQLSEVLAEWLEAAERGPPPDEGDYLRRYPELADELAQCFADWKRFPRPGGPAAPPLAMAEPPLPEQGQLGEYRILREVGHGGMGIVYEAVQESLGRHVALKVLPRQALLKATYLERFRREARAAAHLHHTNIVPVFGVGECEGTHYYAMQFIDGQGLDCVLHDLRRLRATSARCGSPDPADLSARRGSPDPAEPSVAHSLLSGRFAVPAEEPPAARTAPDGASGTSSLSGSGPERQYYRGVARVAVQVADALGYAHRQGILHRDIKPSNLLLDEQGTVWITDFGLAKSEGCDDLTQTGDIVGTIRFMAPERFDGRSLPQSDVYALGATLYELLTLRPTFDDTNKAQLVQKVLHEPPVPPRKHDARIPRDLETVVLKCLAKEPAERYATAEAVAEDLRRFLADRPVLARRSTWRERTWRWGRRNPLVAASLAAVFFSLALGTILASVFAVRAASSARQAEGDRDKAQQAEREGKRKLFESYVSEADAIRMSHRPGQRFGALRRIKDALALAEDIGLSDDDRLRLRNIAVAALCLPDMELGMEWPIGAEKPLPEGLDPVFRRQLLAENTLERLPPPVHWLRGPSWYSQDGRFVAVATQEYTKPFIVPVRVWRIDGPEPVRVLDDLLGAYEEATAFRPDSRQVAIGHADGMVSVYETETGRRARDLPPGPGPTFSLAYHPRLPRLAVANGNEIAIWDVETGLRLVRLSHREGPCVVAWHPRGHRLAVACGDQIHLWDVELGQPITSPWPASSTSGIRLSFSHSGDRVVSNDWGNVLRLWDSSTGRPLLRQGVSGALQFSSDDKKLGLTQSSAAKGVLRLAGGQEMRILLRPTPRGSEQIRAARLHPAGRLLAVVTISGVGLWDLLTGEELGFMAGSFDQRGVHIDRSGALWTCGGSGLLRWPVSVSSSSSGSFRVGPPEWIATRAAGFECAADGQVVAVPLFNDGALLIHRGPPRSTFRLGPQYDVRHAQVSPDGRWVATRSHWIDRSGIRYKLWETNTGRLVADLPYAEVQEINGFTPDGLWLYYSDGKQRKLLEMASLAPGNAHRADVGTATRQPREEGSRIVLTPWGDLCLEGSLWMDTNKDGTTSLVAPETGKEVARLPCEESDASWSHWRLFSPDGAHLLSIGAESGALYVYDLRHIREQLTELGLDWNAPPYPPRKPEEIRPSVDSPLHVELIGAEWASSRARMNEYERHKAVARLAANPLDADARHRLGEVLLDAGRFAEAHGQLSQALALRPDLEPAYLLRARAAFRLGRLDEAAADATRFLKSCPYDTVGRRLRAEVNRARRRYEEAAADLTSLILSYPEGVVYYERRADCYQALGRKEKAAADREKALQLGANSPTRLNERARRLIAGPEVEREPAWALELIERAVQQQPENVLFLSTLSEVQYRNGQYAAAVVTLEKCLAGGRGQSDGFHLFFLSLCHAKLGDRARAKDCFDRAVKWSGAQKDLSADSADELRELRAEAEIELRAATSSGGRP
jgi:serine/threonine protein kinase/WD40 repeat protein/tetratricopeptide (TPR) repeat protein